MTRGTVESPAPRKNLIVFKCSEQESDEIHLMSGRLGMTVSEYMRHAHECAVRENPRLLKRRRRTKPA